jgi:ABC-2 type transport system ATP-binding protein
MLRAMTATDSPSALENVSPDPGAAVVAVHGLTHGYVGSPVLSDLSFELEAASITAFVGRNGAGKSTTLAILAGLMTPWSGQVHVAGGSPWQNADSRRQTGYLPEHPPLYPQVSCHDHVRIAGRLHGLTGLALNRAVQDALRRCDLVEHAQRPARRLSKGMQQRLGLAMAIVHRPRLVLLDEPGSGLDPVQQARLRDLIRDLAEHAAVLYSTHMLNEALAVADHLMVLHSGSLVFQGSRHELADTAGGAEHRLLQLMSGAVSE